MARSPHTASRTGTAVTAMARAVLLALLLTLLGTSADPGAHRPAPDVTGFAAVAGPAHDVLAADDADRAVPAAHRVQGEPTGERHAPPPCATPARRPAAAPPGTARTGPPAARPPSPGRPADRHGTRAPPSPPAPEPLFPSP
ncbi:hypothetical protein [Streptomyces sp. NPDC101249]|uniref:hypothetical protein n=1 Tax=Streptomyces sp. NPDC101249 TaxID=3366140 RepID=UPI00380FBCDC